MDGYRVFWGMVALAGPFGPIIGMIIGSIRYKKYGKEIKEKMKEERLNAQKAGGVKSLYYKHEHKRVFAKTYGIPMFVGLIVGLIVMSIAFHNL